MHFKNALALTLNWLRATALKLIALIFNRRTLMLAVACLCFFAVLVVLDELKDTVDIDQRAKPTQLPLVSVIDVPVQSAHLRVEAYTEVRPQWQVELKTEVSGMVLRVNAEAVAGSRVAKGQVLFDIDNTQYLADLADAKHLLRQSQLDLKRAQYESRVATRQFESAGTKPPNDLALHLPQVEIAKAAVNAAQARVAVAKLQLDRTQIKAPFKGLLVERHISPGQMVMAGEPVARLVGDETYELTVSLSKQQWQQLAHPIVGQNVDLYDDTEQHLGTATVRKAGGYLDADTRHYLVQLVTTHRQANTLAGDYLQAVFTGRVVDNALRIPSTALTVNGYMWWVDADHLMQRSPVKLLARDDQTLVIQAPLAQHAIWKVVAIPLTHYLPGQKVSPQLSRQDAIDKRTTGEG